MLLVSYQMLFTGMCVEVWVVINPLFWQTLWWNRSISTGCCRSLIKAAENLSKGYCTSVSE